jgi:formiminotetrahydrofolate cyclodeaminase
LEQEAPVTSPERSPSEFTDALSRPERAPGGIGAAAYTAAMGLALFEKALAHPAENQAWQAGQERHVLTALRARALALVGKDEKAMAAMDRAVAQPAGTDLAMAVAGARLLAYRSARRLLDTTIQGLTQLQSVLDLSDVSVVTDVEVGRRLVVAAQEAAIAAAEDHLRSMDPGFADAERQALESQAQQGRELVARAEGALSWRRGKA